jgi:hypothetical protein
VGVLNLFAAHDLFFLETVRGSNLQSGRKAQGTEISRQSRTSYGSGKGRHGHQWLEHAVLGLKSRSLKVICVTTFFSFHAMTVLLVLG